MLKPLKILLIEDDVIEGMKFKKVLSNYHIQHDITITTNGADALKYLAKKDNLPNVILLDLNMPKVGGIELLLALKNNSKFKHIPTIILTTSSNYKDLKKCYEIGIGGYIIKPLKFEEYVLKIEIFLDYWSINELIIK